MSPASGASPASANPAKAGVGTHGEAEEPARTVIFQSPIAGPAPEPVTEAEALIQTCKSEIALDASPPRVAQFHCEIAQIYEDLLDHPLEASDHYDHSLQHSPSNMPAIRGARQLYLTMGDFERALPLFAAEAQVAPDSKSKAMMHYQRARVIEDSLHQLAEARRAYQHAWNFDPSSPSIIKSIERMAQQHGDVAELDRAYEHAANATESDSKLRAVWLVKRARLKELHGGDPMTIADLYEQALRLDPGALGAIGSLERLYRRNKLYGPLADVLKRDAASSRDTMDRALSLLRLGRLNADWLSNRQEAITALERARELTESSDRLILEELQRLYEEAERYDAQVGALTALVALATDRREKVALYYRIGQVRELHLGDTDGAIRSYQSALELSPIHLPALQALGNLLTQRKDWLALVQMYLAEADAAESAERRAEANVRIAEICESHIDRREKAIEHYARALAMVPGHTAAFKALTRLYERTGRFRELVDTYELAVEQSKDLTRKRAFLEKVGFLWENALRDPVQAIYAYRRILALDPNNLGAIYALQRVTERAERYGELVEALELEAGKIADRDLIIGLWHRAGSVIDEHLDNWQSAVARFEKALSLNPKHIPSLISMARIYRRLERWEELVATYRRHLEAVTSTEDAVTLHFQLGELCESRLRHAESAIAHYRRAVELDPTYEPALRALVRILRGRGAWAELVQVLETVLPSVLDQRAQAGLYFQAGQIYEFRLSAPERALACYESALRLIPDFRPALMALIQLSGERGDWMRLIDSLTYYEHVTRDPLKSGASIMWRGEIARDYVRDVHKAVSFFEELTRTPVGVLPGLMSLENLYAQTGAWDKLAGVYAAEAQHVNDSGMRTAALRELARIQETKGVGNPGEQTGTYETILTLEPSDEAALLALHRLSRDRDDRAARAEVCRRLGNVSRNSALAARYLTSWGHLIEGSDPMVAMRAYQSALSRDARCLTAIRGLARTAKSVGEHVALADALRREAELLRNPQAASNCLLQSATIQLDFTDDQSGAIAALERALDLWPDNERAAQLLIKPLMKRDQIEHLVDVLSRAASAATSPTCSANHWVEVGRLYADHMNNLAGAISAFVRALRAAPDHVMALRKIAEAYTRDRRWRDAIQAYERVIELGRGRDVICDAHLNLAAMYSQRLNDPRQAHSHLSAVLALEPDHRDAMAALAELHLRSGDAQAGVDLLRRMVTNAPSEAERIAALMKLAKVESSRDLLAEAERALIDALALQGPGGDVADFFKSLIKKGASWPSYVRGMRMYIDRRAGDPERLLPAYLELARVHGDAMKMPREAISNLEEALRTIGRNPTIMSELAMRLRQAGQVAEALAFMRDLVVQEPGRADAWRSMAETLLSIDRPREASLCVTPLVILGEATAEEHKTELTRQKSLVMPPPSSFLPELLQSITLPEVASLPATRLLAAAAEALGKMYASDSEGLGLSRRSRLTLRSNNAWRDLCDRMAAVFGVEYDLHLHSMPEPLVAVELGEPPVIVVADHLTGRPEPEQVFLLAYQMAQIALRMYPANKLSVAELKLALGGAARAVVGDFRVKGLPDDELDREAQRVKRALSRKWRRAHETAAMEYAAAAPIDLAGWRHALQQSALRAALILTSDLVSAVDVVRLIDTLDERVRGAGLIQASPRIADLVRFWNSPTAMNVRRQMGLMT